MKKRYNIGKGKITTIIYSRIPNEVANQYSSLKFSIQKRDRRDCTKIPSLATRQKRGTFCIKPTRWHTSRFPHTQDRFAGRKIPSSSCLPGRYAITIGTLLPSWFFVSPGAPLFFVKRNATISGLLRLGWLSVSLSYCMVIYGFIAPRGTEWCPGFIEVYCPFVKRADAVWHRFLAGCSAVF